MARKLIVEIIGDASSLERSFGSARRATNQFERESSRAFRGVAAGSGAFRSLGRSVAFASGAFLGFATVGQVIRSSIDAATEAQATQRQLAAQFKASGLSLKEYQGRIEEATSRLSQLAGFNRDELTQSFITAFRATKNVSVGLRIMEAAAEASRGTGKSLSATTAALSKAVEGSSASLKRLNIILPANIKGLAILDAVTARFKGQAIAGTTAQERLGAAIHNTQEVIGAALLPTIEKVANSITKWLSKTENQRKLQRDVTRGLRDVEKAGNAVADAFKLADRFSGSFEHTLRTILALVAGSKLLQLLIRSGFVGPGGGAAAGGAGFGLGGLGAAAAGAGGGFLGSAALQRGLGMKTPPGGLGLSGGARRPGVFGAGGVGAIAGAIFAGVPDQQLGNPFGKKNGVYQIGSHWYVYRNGAHGPYASAADAYAVYDASGRTVGVSSGADSPGPHNVPASIAAALKPKTGTGAGVGLNTRLAQIALALAKAGLTSSARDDRRLLVIEAAVVKALIARAVRLKLDLKTRTALYEQLAGIEAQITSIDQAQADAVKAARDKQAAARKAARDRQKQILDQLRQNYKDAVTGFHDAFKAALDDARGTIGQLFGGPVLQPSADALKARLGVRIAGTRVGSLTSDLKAQTAQATQFFKDLARLRSRGASAQLVDELRQGGDIAQAHALAGASPAALRAFLKAFQARERLASRVAIQTPSVRIAAQHVTLAGSRLNADGGHVNVNVYVDGHKVPATVKTTQRRGRHAGTRG